MHASDTLGCIWHAGTKTLLQQNFPVLNWGCRLTLADLHNGSKMVVAAVVGWLEFNVPFQHKYGYIRDKSSGVESYPLTQ